MHDLDGLIIGVDVAVVRALVTELVNKDDNRVVFFWRLLIREYKDVTLRLDNSSLVFREQLDHLFDDPSTGVAGVQARHLTNDDDVVKLMLGVGSCSLLEDLIKEILRHTGVSAEEVQEVGEVEQRVCPFW